MCSLWGAPYLAADGFKLPLQLYLLFSAAGELTSTTVGGQGADGEL